MHNILDSFIRGRDILDLFLGNQRVSYNKFGIGYEPKNNINFLVTYDMQKGSCHSILVC